MSWKPMVQVSNAEWQDNALRFATEDEARRYARDLFNRRSASTAYTAVLSLEPVNYTYSANLALKPVEKYFRRPT